MHRTTGKSLTRTLGAAVLAAAVAAGCGKPSEAQLLAAARQRLAKHENAAAIIELKNTLEAFPKSGEARFLLGSTLMASGNPAAAELELVRARELDYPDKEVAPLLATAMLANGRPGAAILAFQAVQLPDPAAQAELLTNLALAYAVQGDLRTATEQNEQALRLAPGSLPAGVLKARLKAASGDVAAATVLIDMLLAQAPEHAQAWVVKGDLLRRGDADLPAAVAAYRKAISLRADQSPAHSGLLGILIAQRNIPAANEALAAMKKALPQHPDTRYFDGMLAYLRGDFAATRTITQQLLRNSPANPRYLLLAGQAELELKSLAQAEALIAKAVGEAPAVRLPRLRLAVVQMRSGQADKALATLQPLTTGKNPDTEALSLEGQIYLERGELKRAQASFANAAKIAPANPAARMGTALSLLAQGQDNDGFRALDALAKGSPGNTAADLALIAARLDRGQYDAALAAIDAMAAKQPKQTQTQTQAEFLRGRVKAMRGDPAGARTHFEAVLQTEAGHAGALKALTDIDLAEHKVAAARQRYEQLLQREPGNVMAMLALADLQSREPGQAEAVVALLDKAIKANPLDPNAHIAAISLYLRQGNNQRALAAAQAAVSLIPNDASLLERLGLAQLYAGDVQQAIATLGRVASMQPQSALAQLRLADAYRAANDLTAAEPHVRRALQLAPAWPAAQHAGVVMAMRAKKTDQALAMARAIQTRQPGEAIGFRLEGDVEAGRKQWDAAAAAFRKALAKDNPADSAVRLHWALVNAGKTADAREFADTWLRDHAADARFNGHLADIALLRGDLAAAESHYRRVLALSADDISALNNLAYLTLKQGKPGAIALAERAVRLAPERADLLDTLAQAYAAEKQIDKAIDWQRKAVELAPNKGGLRLTLARMYLQAGKKDRALDELQRLAKLGPVFSAQDDVARLTKEAGG